MSKLLLAIVAMAMLGGCVVYDRPYYHDHDHYYHDRDYRDRDWR